MNKLVVFIFTVSSLALLRSYKEMGITCAAFVVSGVTITDARPAF